MNPTYKRGASPTWLFIYNDVASEPMSKSAAIRMMREAIEAHTKDGHAITCISSTMRRKTYAANVGSNNFTVFITACHKRSASPLLEGKKF